jgi:hypothetical protein
MNPIIRTRTHYFRHAYHPSRDNIKKIGEDSNEKPEFDVDGTEKEYFHGAFGGDLMFMTRLIRMGRTSDIKSHRGRNCTTS